jgi:hypothetical protein
MKKCWLFHIIFLFLDYSYCQNSIDFTKINCEYTTDSNLTRKSNPETKFYAFGSWHGHNSAYKSFVTCFKQLYLKANIRVVFIEYSYSVGLLFDNYIKTGDTDEYMETYVLKNDYAYFLNPLKMFNFSLPDSEKISIVGVDRSFSIGVPDVVYAIKLLLPKNKEPDEKIRKVVLDIASYSVQADFKHESKVILDDFFMCFIKNKPSFREYFSNCFETLEKVLIQYIQSKNIPDVNYENCDSASFCRREKFVYSNLKSEISARPGVSYMGLFGWAHVYLDRTNRFDTFQIKHGDDYEYYSFIARLNKESDSPAKGSVCAVQIHESNLVFRKALKKIVGKRIFRQMMKQTKRKNTYMFDFSKDSTKKEISENKFQYLLLLM